MQVNIGQKIKSLRLAADLTQEELANRAMLTKGFISQLENKKFQTSISLESLSDIVDALGVSLSEFFAETKHEQIVYSRKDRIPVETEGASNFELLVPGSTNNIMDTILMEIEPGQSLPLQDPHNGEQFGYVLKGKLSLVVNKKRYDVKKSDCFYFSSHQSYQFSNKSNVPVTFLYVITPPQM